MRGRRTTHSLVAALCLVLASCGGRAAPPGSPPPSPAASPTEVSGTVVVWHYFQTPGQLDALERMAKLFRAKYPKVEVKQEFQPFDQMTPNLLAAAAAQRGPDVVIYQWGDVLKLVQAGALASMESYWSSWPDAQQFPDSVVHRVAGQDYSPDGEVYTIQPYANLIALYYNQDILDQFGLQPPTTIDELEAALRTVVEGGHQGLVFDAQPGVHGWWVGMPFMWGEGLDMRFTPEDEPALERVFARLASWVDKGYVTRDVVTFDQQTAMAQWLTGEFAFTINGNWELTRVRQEAHFHWGVVRFPAGPQGSSVYLGGEGLAMGAFSENPDLAWEYLSTTWLSREGQLSLIDTIGSLPARRDVAGDPAITETPGLAPFAEAVASGYRLPVTQQENEAQTLFGDTFSAVMAGQISPAEAAHRIVTETPRIFAGGD